MEEYKIMTLNELLEDVKNNPLNYIRYLEILILPTGKILKLQASSHAHTMINLACEKSGKSFKEVRDLIINYEELDYLSEYLNVVPVWHCGYIVPSKMTRFQKRVIKILQKHELILKDNEACIAHTDKYKEKIL